LAWSPSTSHTASCATCSAAGTFLHGEVNEFVDLLPAQQRIDEESWYRGTADAVYQNIDILETYTDQRPEFVVILAGDHVYKMNYALMLVDHVESGAECTVACIEVPRGEASGFGVMAVDENGLITDFIEKPADPPAMPGNPDMAMCSMGVYVFNAKYLYAELARDIADPSPVMTSARTSSRVRSPIGWLLRTPSRAVASLPRMSSSGSTTGVTPGPSMPTGTPTST
jgi:ADP-glucose pyrophosphorylase